MAGYSFEVGCPHSSCAGAPLGHVNGSHTASAARAVAVCTRCGARWLLVVELVAVEPAPRDQSTRYRFPVSA